MSTTDDDWTLTGYDPEAVTGFDDDGELVGEVEEDPLPNPLDGVAYTDDLEIDAAAELDAARAGFRSRMGVEAERVDLATMADFWVCLCFTTQAQRDAFVTGSGWADLGYRYMDGRQVAKRLAVDLPPDPDWTAQHRSAAWDRYAMTVEENRSIDE